MLRKSTCALAVAALSLVITAPGAMAAGGYTETFGVGGQVTLDVGSDASVQMATDALTIDGDVYAVGNVDGYSAFSPAADGAFVSGLTATGASPAAFGAAHLFAPSDVVADADAVGFTKLLTHGTDILAAGVTRSPRGFGGSTYAAHLMRFASDGSLAWTATAPTSWESFGAAALPLGRSALLVAATGDRREVQLRVFDSDGQQTSTAPPVRVHDAGVMAVGITPSADGQRVFALVAPQAPDAGNSMVGDYRVLAFRNDGSLDAAWGTSGHVDVAFTPQEHPEGPARFRYSHPSQILSTADGGLLLAGKAVVAGEGWISSAGYVQLAKVDSDGTPDLSFGANGRLTLTDETSWAPSVSRYDDEGEERFLVANDAPGGKLLTALDETGALDPEFAFGGRGLLGSPDADATLYVRSVAMSEYGDFLAAGGLRPLGEDAMHAVVIRFGHGALKAPESPEVVEPDPPDDSDTSEPEPPDSPEPEPPVATPTPVPPAPDQTSPVVDVPTRVDVRLPRTLRAARGKLVVPIQADRGAFTACDVRVTAKVGRRTVTISTSRVRGGGASLRANVKLTAAGSRALRRAGKRGLKVSIVVIAQRAHGAPLTGRASTTLRA